MTSQLIVRTYQAGSLSVEVPFTQQAFFNATEVAKPFNKQPRDWLKTREVKEYIEAVKKIFLTEQDQLVIQKKGGNPYEQGTWFHPKLAIAFARWLSPHFAVWCDFQIEKILLLPPCYHYPKDTAKPYEMFTARQAWLTYPNLTDERSGRPLRDLLRQLQADGHDVEGASIEYSALQCLAERYYWTLVDIERSAHNARLTGLNVVWEPAPPTPKKR